MYLKHFHYQWFRHSIIQITFLRRRKERLKVYCNSKWFRENHKKDGKLNVSLGLVTFLKTASLESSENFNLLSFVPGIFINCSISQGIGSSSSRIYFWLTDSSSSILSTFSFSFSFSFSYSCSRLKDCSKINLSLCLHLL